MTRFHWVMFDLDQAICLTALLFFETCAFVNALAREWSCSRSAHVGGSAATSRRERMGHRAGRLRAPGQSTEGNPQVPSLDASTLQGRRVGPPVVP